MKVLTSATSIALLLLFVVTIKDGSWAFVNNHCHNNGLINRCSRKDTGGTKRMVTSTTNPPPSNDEAAAKAMTEYLAKSHEEKLKNLQLLREKDDYIQVSIQNIFVLFLVLMYFLLIIIMNIFRRLFLFFPYIDGCSLFLLPL
jgi:hypothetical protein